MTAYVTADGGGTVTPINLATNIPGTPIPIGTHFGHPMQFVPRLAVACG